MMQLNRLYFNNARQVISQIKSGEWVADRVESDGCVCDIVRGDQRIMVINGGRSCEIRNKYGVTDVFFGCIYRHWVWFHAKKIVRLAIHEHKLSKIKEIRDGLGIK